MPLFKRCCIPEIPSCHSCTEDSAEFGTMSFAITSGLHPLSFSRPLRSGNAGFFCQSSIGNPNAAIKLPRDLGSVSCCAERFGYVLLPSDDSSSAVYAQSRRFAAEFHRNLSGSVNYTCPLSSTSPAEGVVTAMPWQIVTDRYYDAYYTMASKRVVDYVNLKICMVTDGYGFNFTQIDCEIAYRVLIRTYFHTASPFTSDCFVHRFTSYSEPPCTPIVKRCVSACSAPPVDNGYESTTPLECGTNCVKECTADGVIEQTLAVIENRCDGITTLMDVGSFNDNCPKTCRSNDRRDRIQVYSRKLKRRKLLSGHCNLPVAMTFLSSENIPYPPDQGNWTDLTIGYTPPTIVDFCGGPSFGRVTMTGQTTPFTVYQALTEDWTVNLS